jgi:predicted nucleic acid-binding protein
VIVIDASVWLSVILSSDVHHPETRAWSDLISQLGTELAVPAHFPAEVIGVLQRTNHLDNLIDDAIETIVGRGPFTIHPVSVELGLFSAEAARVTAMRGADAVYVALAAWLDTPLITWDRQQRDRGKLFCRTMTPVEALALED